MAVDKKVSGLPETAQTSGGFSEIILPDGSGGWISWKISNANLVGSFTSEIDAINAYINQATQTYKEKNKSADFTKSFDADTAIDGIDFMWVSGTPNVKVGTSALANDVISGRTPLSGDPSRNLVSEYYLSAQTLYFTVTGGTVNIVINYRNNYSL